jgi:hypothetical protein
MDQNSLNQLLERRVNLLRQLADSLRRSHAALLTPDYNEIPVQTKAQQYLCQELGQLARIPPSETVPQLAIFANTRQKALVNELQGLQAQVADLNRRYAALLRRAQRTVQIFCRVLENSGLTYVAPATARISAIQQERR